LVISAKLCAGTPADFGAASDVSDTLPFDVSMAATPTMVEGAVSPDHSAESKRSSFQKKPEGTEKKDTSGEKTMVSGVSGVEEKNENIAPEEPKVKTRAKRKDPGTHKVASKTKNETVKKEDANPFTPSDAEARYMCDNKVCCKGWVLRTTDFKKSHRSSHVSHIYNIPPCKIKLIP